MKNFLIKKIKGVISVFLILLLSLTFISCTEEETNNEPYTGTKMTDELKFMEDYEGKSFLKDGIGLVTLNQNVDGDTAHFADVKTGEWFTARFLCINTPESTGRIDAWGKQASKFVAGILSKADVIVCESKVNGQPAEKDSTLKRYLAYVWYKIGDADFRLLNLEIVENGYSRFTDDYTQVKYGEQFNTANLNSYALNIKVFGEKDPNYDYTGQTVEISIAELKANFDQYSGGTRLIITARVMRFVGNNVYLQDLNETENEETGELTRAAIYMFSGYSTTLSVHVKIGQVIRFECQCTDNDNYGRQLTNPNNVRIVGDEPEDYTVIELSSEDLPQGGVSLAEYEGFVVKVDKLTVKSKTKEENIAETGAYTIYCVTEDGKEVNVRIDGSANPKLDYYSVTVGSSYTVVGGVSKYQDTFQIMLGNQKTDIEKGDFVLIG